MRLRTWLVTLAGTALLVTAAAAPVAPAYDHNSPGLAEHDYNSPVLAAHDYNSPVLAAHDYH